MPAVLWLTYIFIPCINSKIIAVYNAFYYALQIRILSDIISYARIMFSISYGESLRTTNTFFHLSPENLIFGSWLFFSPSIFGMSLSCSLSSVGSHQKSFGICIIYFTQALTGFGLIFFSWLAFKISPISPVTILLLYTGIFFVVYHFHISTY